jgi:hypothetical protein
MNSAPTVVPTVVATPRRGALKALLRDTDRCRLAVLYRLAGDLGEAQESCQALVSDGDRAWRLPEALDRKLHELSMHLSSDLERTVRAVVHRTVSAAPGRRRTQHRRQQAIDRVRAACHERPGRLLVVTRTAEVIATTGRGARPLLVTHRSLTDVPVVGPVEVELDAGCYPWWRQRHLSATEASTWLQAVLDSVAAALLNEVVARFRDVRAALVGILDERAGLPITELDAAEKAA